jgi:hypothetical protein
MEPDVASDVSARSRLRRAVRAAGAGAAALGVMAVALAYWMAVRAPAAGVFHDDGIYAVTAKSLATGRGYRIVSLPGEIAQTKYPFLFPALLAAVWKIAPRFPENLIWLKLVPLACALLWGALGYRLLRENTGSAPLSLALTGLMAVSPWVLFLGTALLSETLFAATLTGTLLLLSRIERGNSSWTTLVGVALVASAAFLTRTVGVVAVVTGVLILWDRGRRKQMLVFGLICASLCGPWVWWQAHQNPGAIEPYLSAANYESWNIVLDFTPAQKAHILVENLISALLAPAVLMGVPATGWGAGLVLLAGGLVLIGWAMQLASRFRVCEIFVALYTGVIVLWAWPPARFLAPLLPLLLLYGYLGVQGVCRVLRVSARGTRAVSASIAILCMVQSGWVLAETAALAHETGAVPVPNMAQDDWRETARMLEWVTSHTAADAVLMGNLDPVLYLYTGRKSVRGFLQDPFLLHYSNSKDSLPLGSVDDMLSAIERYGVTYLIQAPNAAFREGPYLSRLSDQLVTLHPGSFRCVYQSSDSHYRIYAVIPDTSLQDLSLKPHFKPHGRLLVSN